MTRDFTANVFSTPAQRLHQMSATVLRHVGDPGRPLRVLEIGCGTGEQMLDLARRLPSAHFTGIDLSAPSIALATERCANSSLSHRVELVLGDYLDFRARAFDVIYSYSTLHLIPGSTARLFSKIAHELAPGGLFVFAMPRQCARDGALIAARRLLVALRGPVTDALVFRLGKLLHGHELSDELLRERVHYMYVLPHRLGGAALNDFLLRECGLQMVEQFDLPKASVAQPQHAMSVFCRSAG